MEMREEGAAPRRLPPQRVPERYRIYGEQDDIAADPRDACVRSPGSCSAVEKWMNPSCRSCEEPA